MNFPYAALSAAACPDLRHRFRGRLSGAETGRLDRQGFQIPHRRDDAGAAAALHHDRRADRPAGAGAARLGRLGRQHADAGFRRRIVRPRPAAGCREILHHHSRQCRPRQIVKTLRRDEDRISEIQLRGHGRRAVSPGQGRARRQTSAARDRQFDGRHAHLDLGRQISAIHGRAGADGVAADRDGGAQLDAAADDARDHPQRSRLQWRQLHHPAAHDEIRHQRLWHRDRRRHAGLSGAGADGGEGRQDGRRPAGDRRSPPMPTTSSISGKPRTITIRLPRWRRSRRRCC